MNHKELKKYTPEFFFNAAERVANVCGIRNHTAQHFKEYDHIHENHYLGGIKSLKRALENPIAVWAHQNSVVIKDISLKQYSFPATFFASEYPFKKEITLEEFVDACMEVKNAEVDV